MKIQKAMCFYCCGHAIARAVCVICAAPLCNRHTHVVDGKGYCKFHKPGYVA